MTIDTSRLFIGLWLLLLAAKIAIGAWLPPFSDEVFWYWESNHPAWMYADIPGLTAWLIGLGVDLAGTSPIGLRLAFLALGATIPWLVVRITARWFGPEAGWTAGLLALLMPASSLMGLFAAPDVPLIVAGLLCLDAIARLRERVGAAALATLALGLAMGALSHYRFAPILAAGLVGMLLDPPSRRLFRDTRVWGVLVVGTLAWLPVILWNVEHAAQGARFQFVERHPWAFQKEGLRWIPSQMLMVTPLLFILLAATLWRLARHWRQGEPGPWGLLLGLAGVPVLGYFILGFFADRDHISFHWPAPGWLFLLAAAPWTLASWPRPARAAVWSVTGLGLAGFLALLVASAAPPLRANLAGHLFYPDKFAGWGELAATINQMNLPADTLIVADNFELGSQLNYALGEGPVRVLDHPRNHLSGRAIQLRHWGREYDPSRDWKNRLILLVVEDASVHMADRLRANLALCTQFGGLPAPLILNLDHGLRRFLLYRIDRREAGPCVLPALSYIDRPARHARLGPHFEVAGWAFKHGMGIAAIDVTLDGTVVARANYGLAMPHVADYWREARDPNMPNVGFTAQVDASRLSPGRHWLGLVLHGTDGRHEASPEIPVTLSR